MVTAVGICLVFATDVAAETSSEWIECIPMSMSGGNHLPSDGPLARLPPNAIKKHKRMKIKGNIKLLYNACDRKFEEQFEFKMRDVSFEKMAAYMYRPKDSSSLAVTRILFGLAMLFDIPDERGGAAMERRWGDSKICHFPLLPFLKPLPMPYMGLVYAALWLGALGILLGFKYRLTSATFAACYWYLFLAEKSYWNNHSYLFGLVAVLLACTDASCYWSLDAYLDPARRKETVPYWNYFVLKYQFFILYFMAGLKKGTAEWLTGYSVQSLSEHWVFAPFRLFLTVPQTDYLVVHWFIFAFDLTVAGWMMWSHSRHLAMLFCALFHLMNSRLFHIGMFPWVCLATMPLFYPFDWPKLVIKYVKDKCETQEERILSRLKCYIANRKCEYLPNTNSENENNNIENEENNLEFDDDDDDVFLNDENNDKLTNNVLCKNKTPNEHLINNAINNVEEETIEHNKYTIYLIIFYVVLQAFLPYSHFITKGYNNWTNGLYGYSWDMMVHTWDHHSVVVKVVDHSKNAEFYVDPYLFTPNDRWTRHGDMVYQYAHCIEDKIREANRGRDRELPINISIYIDVWCSMNGRFAQRMFDPRVNLLKASWSPFTPMHYLMPILDEALHWRETLADLRNLVTSWGDHNDVTFFADFPGYEQEKFIPSEMKNVSLTVLAGEVAFEPEVTMLFNGQSERLTTGSRVKVSSEMFHKVLNIGDEAAFYMYTYYNSTDAVDNMMPEEGKPKLPIGRELMRRLANMVKFAGIVLKSVIQSVIKLSKCFDDLLGSVLV